MAVRSLILSRVVVSVTNNNGFWIGLLDLLTHLYNISYSQSIIALPLIYRLHKSLRHALRFVTTDFSHELSLQITMKSSHHFSFNHFGIPTLQNSAQFSNLV
jgi:hypothetical protein